MGNRGPLSTKARQNVRLLSHRATSGKCRGTMRADARVAKGLNANTHWSDMVKYYSYGCVRELEKNDDILLSKGTNSDF